MTKLWIENYIQEDEYKSIKVHTGFTDSHSEIVIDIIYDDEDCDSSLVEDVYNPSLEEVAWLISELIECIRKYADESLTEEEMSKITVEFVKALHNLEKNNDVSMENKILTIKELYYKKININFFEDHNANENYSYIYEGTAYLIKDGRLAITGKKVHLHPNGDIEYTDKDGNEHYVPDGVGFNTVEISDEIKKEIILEFLDNQVMTNTTFAFENGKGLTYLTKNGKVIATANTKIEYPNGDIEYSNE